MTDLAQGDEAKLYPEDDQLHARAQQLASQRIEGQVGGLTCALTSAEAVAAVYRDQVVTLRALVDNLHGQLLGMQAAAGDRPAAPPARRRK